MAEKQEGTEKGQIPEKEDEGRYLYCVVNSGANTNLGEIGIDDCIVYTVPYKDIGAVVHNCAAKPYESKDEQVVKEWILAHQYVIDEATKKFGTVVPFSFDTIIKRDEEKVKEWLSEEYFTFKEKLESVRDKAEYTIQIFCDKTPLMEKIREDNKEIKKLEKDITTKPKGVAYMLNKKLEIMLKDGFRILVDRYAKDFYDQIKTLVDEIKAEPTNKPVPDKWKDEQMIINLCCLVPKDKVEKLSKELGKINEKEEFSVRFTGPWAPFSFAGKEIGG